MAKLAEARIQVNAAPDTVWNALTDPALIEKYFFGTHVESDWKVGSRVVYRGEWDGGSYEDHGLIRESDPPRLLVLDFFSPSSGLEDVPENYQRITYRLTEQPGDETLLELTQDNNADDEGAERASANWASVLDGLAAVIEGRS